MTLFKEREAAAEAAFVHDQELLFLARAHRTSAIAEWVGGQVGKTGADLAAYRDDMQALAVREGDEALLRRLHADLDAAGTDVPLPTLQHKMDALLTKAIADVRKA